MTKRQDTKEKIIEVALRMFAYQGYDGVSMRKLAKEVGVAQSVMYHYFADKDILLKSMFDFTNTRLGALRAKLPDTANAQEMLYQRIIFQIDHSEEIVAVLKYYLTYRTQFPKLESGFVPEKAYLHIEEVLRRGEETGEFYTFNIAEDAKVITHAINGFLLEYYPHKPRGAEKEKLAQSIYQFLLRALMCDSKGGEKK